ncbi:MAG: WD40 repeat domain-containing protein [Nonlabens sp.]|jgi:WD40 repeat protein|uniref:WD40 repeat domain-containing protein n=1 Tax=Nonlabens sp. TaxID=1888209 RepID=UPI0035A71EE3
MKTIKEMSMDVKHIATLTGHSGCIYAMDKGMSEQTVFTGGSDRFIALWNLETQQAEKFSATLPAPIYSICHVPEKKLLLAGTTTGSIHLLDLEKKEEIKILKHHQGPVFDIKYSSKTNCFYTAGGDGNFAVCSFDTLSLIKMKKLSHQKVRSIDFNYTTSEIAVALGDSNVLIFDLFTLEYKNDFMAHQVGEKVVGANAVRYSPDGNFLLTGGRDAHLNIWQVGNYELVKSIPAHNWAIYDIVFSPDANLFATASRDKTVKIWDAKTYQLLKRITKENFEAHTHSVNKLIWSTYHNYLVSVGDDRMVMVREVNRK